jgi:Ca2+-binding RTX toxin-like protein
MGGPHDDRVFGGPGEDRVFGHAGNDIVRTQDSEADLAQGGPGDDVCHVDGLDTERLCETSSIILPLGAP